MKFRADINGLRAFAVIAVVLFHFYPSSLTGGFAGVDVFFVISGYLMTAIIFNRIVNNSFSLFSFYVSRANRIIPPLAVLCVVLATWSYYFLPIYDLRIVGRDLFGAITFSSNIIFSLKQDYFEGNTNFLLHTWSLSAEWQFYVIYPILIVAVSQLVGVTKSKYFVLFLFVASLITSIVFSSIYPSQSYYLLPTRAWEMIAGGLAFLFPLSFSRKAGKKIEILGIALVICSYLIIDEETIWPGYMALLPVTGTYLVILSSSYNSVLTGNRFAQHIGRWSYSIYLWHWPIAVGFSYYFIPSDLKFLGLILSIFLGFLSFKYIESLSFKSISITKSSYIHSGAIVFLASIGLVTYLTNGLAFKENLNSNSLVYGGMNNNYEKNEGRQLINTKGEYDYVMIGDSKAGHFVRGILKTGDKVNLSWYSDCMSFPSAYTFSNSFGSVWDKKCKNNYKTLDDSVSSIIISQRWNRYSDPDFKFYCTMESCDFSNEYEVGLLYLMGQWIEKVSPNRKIYIIGELPRTTDKAIEVCLRNAAIFSLSHKCNVGARPIEGVERVNKALSKVASFYENVFFIDPTGAICNESGCKYGFENKPLFLPDLSHLTGLGAEVFWSFISKRIAIIESEASNRDLK